MDILPVQNNLQLSDKVLNAFPQRSLKLTPLSGDGGMIRSLFLIVFLVVLTAFSAYQLPNIAYDYKIGQNAVPVDADIDGSCKTNLLVITNCKVELRYKHNVVSHDFTFVGLNGGDIAVMPLMDATDPSKLTVDVAVDNVMLRFVTTIALIGLFIFCIFFFIRAQIRISKIRKELLSVGSQPLQLIAIPAKVINANRQIIATYQRELNGKQISTGYSGKKTSAPIVLESNGKTYVLAVASAQQNIPYVLDFPMQRIQATPEEVQHFHNVLQEEGII
ncbi:hypothetical protein GKR51_10325 [Providencia sp. wls1948]|nr:MULTISPECIES: hypothetical protein [unclassified Providencia]MTB38855.1 hypothetical protein [Providencia sp. wls1949]MTC08551.1 hypothetical protein [Providencia sp. wls1948]